MSASTAAAATRGNGILPAMLPSTATTTNLSQQFQQKNLFNRTSSATPTTSEKRFAGLQFSWIHFLAGGAGGMTGALVTSPLDLVKTRLQEGPRALYKGLGPNLVGVIPARMQLQVGGVRQYKNSMDCIYQIVKSEGIRGMYRGLSASYLGVAEGSIQWVIYEHLKKSLTERRKIAVLNGEAKSGYIVGGKDVEEWVDYLGAAGAAKFIASAITYPHEVLRTRLRQVPIGNEPAKYTGLKQTFQLVLKEEGVAALYGGLTAHMMRVVPNAAIMFFCYEAIMHRFG
ncbi:hypothetical protein BGZ76_009994 [Entomortierella beljakovae]|nr:hypothetical protein BGZ76_009994 [Entomortierella beljakovae]